jgi:thiamine-phosphate pyrophosphorylase
MPKATMGSDRALRGLYAVTPEIADTARLVAAVEAALAGGAAAIQYRAKNAHAAKALEQARALAAVCRAARVPLIVNDSLELALAADADGVHLGREDVDAKTARARFPGGIIGVSCYADLARVRDSAEAGADYVAIGSVFASSTKPSAVRAPLRLLADAKALSSLPVVAIGGITPANAPSAIEAGADMVAVISAVFDAADIKASAQDFARLFAAHPSKTGNVRTQPQAL